MEKGAQKSVEKTNETNDFQMNEDFYKQDLYIPNSVVNILEINKIRGRSFALLEIAPVQYNPASGKIRMMRSVDVNIHFNDVDIQKTITSI